MIEGINQWLEIFLARPVTTLGDVVGILVVWRLIEGTFNLLWAAFFPNP